MAKQRRRPVRRRDRKGGPTSTRRKSCPYCRDKIDQVDYKDVSMLRRFAKALKVDMRDLLADAVAEP